MIRAVLFDVGGPLDLEVRHEAAMDAVIREGLRRERFEVSDEDWADAERHAVDSFAPNLYRSLIWQLTNADAKAARRVYQWVESQAVTRDLFDLRPGILEVLESLNRRGLKLGLAANQPATTLPKLERHGIGQYFANAGMSGVYGFRKPDVRLFLRACEDLDLQPAECIMVGDRIDNDIVPANLLGMRTVLIRTGRHGYQRPRSWDEVPDDEVEDASGMLAAIEALTSATP